MNNLCWQKFLGIALCCSTLVTHYLFTEKRVTANELSQQSFSLLGSKSQKQKNVTPLPLLLAESSPSRCQSIDPGYQDYYNFETRNYNISMCRQGEQWFYYRESKSNSDSVVFVSAEVVFGGDVFKAVDGKVTYFVGTNSDGYYSSVMYGNNQMIFEPELALSTASIKQQEETTTSILESTPENIDSQNLDLSTNYWKVCTDDRHDVHPYLNGWQKFIGESPNAISDYASVEGHNFQYSNANTARAMIETTDGLMVTMDILKLTETVNSVCVKPITSF